MSDDYLTCTSSSDFSKPPTMAELQEAMRKGREIRHDMLRGLAKLCETECSVCRRHPTVTQSSWGDTLQLCRHYWEALHQLAAKYPAPPEPHKNLPTLYGLRVELFDDGPARF